METNFFNGKLGKFLALLVVLGLGLSFNPANSQQQQEQEKKVTMVPGHFPVLCFHPDTVKDRFEGKKGVTKKVTVIDTAQKRGITVTEYYEEDQTFVFIHDSSLVCLLYTVNLQGV